jgi:hypothetical protein
MNSVLRTRRRPHQAVHPARSLLARTHFETVWSCQLGQDKVIDQSIALLGWVIRPPTVDVVAVTRQQKSEGRAARRQCFLGLDPGANSAGAAREKRCLLDRCRRHTASAIAPRHLTRPGAPAPEAGDNAVLRAVSQASHQGLSKTVQGWSADGMLRRGCQFSSGERAELLATWSAAVVRNPLVKGSDGLPRVASPPHPGECQPRKVGGARRNIQLSWSHRFHEGRAGRAVEVRRRSVPEMARHRFSYGSSSPRTRFQLGFSTRDSPSYTRWAVRRIPWSSPFLGEAERTSAQAKSRRGQHQVFTVSLLFLGPPTWGVAPYLVVRRRRPDCDRAEAVPVSTNRDPTCHAEPRK